MAIKFEIDPRIRERQMAKVPDMEIEFKQSERIALIDSAVELVTIFANREPTLCPPPEYGSEPSLATEEAQAYRSALAFLQMQYELEKPVVVMRHPIPEMSETDRGCM